MTGPTPSWSSSSWPQTPEQQFPQQQFPQTSPPAGGQVAWAGDVAAPAALRPAVDVGGLLRLVSGGLLVAAGVLVAIACALTVFGIESEFGDPPFEATAWNDSGDRYPTPVRWGIPMAAAATVLLIGGALVLVSRWSVRLRGVAAATAAAAVGGVLAVGWTIGGYVGDLDDTLRANASGFEGSAEVLRTGAGTVLLQIALWTALAAAVPLVLASVVDALRARAAVGGAR